MHHLSSIRLQHSLSTLFRNRTDLSDHAVNLLRVQIGNSYVDSQERIYAQEGRRRADC